MSFHELKRADQSRVTVKLGLARDKLIEAQDIFKGTRFQDDVESFIERALHAIAMAQDRAEAERMTQS